MVKIAGSFLKIQSDAGKIGELDKVCDYIHFDVMDGKFTENATFSIDKMKNVISELKKPFDVHLMVYDIKKYVDEVLPFNPSYIIFHLEATDDIEEIITYIHDKGCKAGIAINPDTLVSKIYPYLDKLDIVLVMSVKAGAGGQSFIDITSKIDDLIRYRDDNNLSYLIEVDGGINDSTIKLVRDVDIVVAGSFITSSDNYQGQIYKLKKSLRNGFTLAELLGVIVVLAILGLVAVTTIDNNIKESRYDSCMVQKETLIEGAKMVMIDYPDLLPTSSNMSVTMNVSTLQDGGTVQLLQNGSVINSKALTNGGYIPDQLVNPMTDKPFVSSASGVSVVVTTSNGSDFDYTVKFGNASEDCHK